MFGTILRLFRARYALSVLLLIGAVQGYSMARLVSNKLPALPLFDLIWGGGKSAKAIEPPPQAGMGPIAMAVVETNPLLRTIYWLLAYGLLCLATVPLIKRALAHESNVVNAVLILSYSLFGGLLAFGLMAFRFTWITGIVGALAFICATAGIVRLAGELERFRVEDMMGQG
jgi:hypothetical protein